MSLNKEVYQNNNNNNKTPWEQKGDEKSMHE